MRLLRCTAFCPNCDNRFGGSKNAGIVVGIVDGIVYPGTGLQSVIIGYWSQPAKQRLKQELVTLAALYSHLQF